MDELEEAAKKFEEQNKRYLAVRLATGVRGQR